WYIPVRQRIDTGGISANPNVPNVDMLDIAWFDLLVHTGVPIYCWYWYGIVPGAASAGDLWAMTARGQVGGPCTGNMTDWYVPPVPGGTGRNYKS
ncbi:hypothetical protein BHM03_00034399, partial [Ensete ventricosum]